VNKKVFKQKEETKEHIWYSTVVKMGMMVTMHPCAQCTVFVDLISTTLYAFK